MESFGFFRAPAVTTVLAGESAGEAAHSQRCARKGHASGVAKRLECGAFHRF